MEAAYGIKCPSGNPTHVIPDSLEVLYQSKYPDIAKRRMAVYADFNLICTMAHEREVHNQAELRCSLRFFFLRHQDTSSGKAQLLLVFYCLFYRRTLAQTEPPSSSRKKKHTDTPSSSSSSVASGTPPKRQFRGIVLLLYSGYFVSNLALRIVILFP